MNRRQNKNRKILKNAEKKRFKAMEEEIKTITNRAYQDTHGISHKFVKKATANIREKYSEPKFINNENYMLYRYKKLEFRQYIPNLLLTFMVGLALPKILGLVSDFFNEVYKLFTSPDTVKVILTGMVFTSPVLTVLFSVILLLVILVCIYVISLIYQQCMMFKRTDRQTILENELKIIEAVLKERDILL